MSEAEQAAGPPSGVTARFVPLARRWWPVVLLGILTVGSYGLAFYSFGVFLESIATDTGWSRGGLSAAFAAGSLLGGAGGVISGRLLDAVGPRPVFTVSLTAGSVLILFAASAPSLPLFVALWGAGAGVIAAGLYYNVTMAVTARLFPADRAVAFTVLTVVGGLASPIFFPLAGFAIEEWGWRVAMRALVAVQIVFVTPAILFLPRVATGDAAEAAGGASAGYGGLREALRSREVLQMIAMFALSMLALSALQVHHVAAMRAAGLSLATAASVAAIRGFLSLGGRAMVAMVERRMGTPGALMAVYSAMAVGTLFLAAGGQPVFIWSFAIVTGLAFGTVIPLQGLHAAEVYGEQRLGTFLGIQQAVMSLVGAAGPLLAGLSVDAAGSYGPALVLMAAVQVAAIVLLATRPRRPSAARS